MDFYLTVQQHFLFLQVETEDSADITSLMGDNDQGRAIIWNGNFSGFTNPWGLLGYASTQLHEIYHTVQVVFGYFITKILHIVLLKNKETQISPTVFFFFF